MSRTHHKRTPKFKSPRRHRPKPEPAAPEGPLKRVRWVAAKGAWPDEVSEWAWDLIRKWEARDLSFCGRVDTGSASVTGPDGDAFRGRVRMLSTRLGAPHVPRGPAQARRMDAEDD